MKSFADVQLTFRIPSLSCVTSICARRFWPLGRATRCQRRTRAKRTAGGSMDNPDREMVLDEIAKARTALEYQTEKCGMYLGVHAIHRPGTS